MIQKAYKSFLLFLMFLSASCCAMNNQEKQQSHQITDIFDPMHCEQTSNLTIPDNLASDDEGGDISARFNHLSLEDREKYIEEKLSEFEIQEKEQNNDEQEEMPFVFMKQQFQDEQPEKFDEDMQYFITLSREDQLFIIEKLKKEIWLLRFKDKLEHHIQNNILLEKNKYN